MTPTQERLARKIARLDGRATRIFAGLPGSGGFDVTVPAGERWELLAAHWNCGWRAGPIAAGGFVPLVKRQLGIDNVIPLPAGSALQSCDAEGMSLSASYAVVRAPERAFEVDARYQQDAATLQAMYDDWWNKIAALPLHFTGATLPATAITGFGDQPADLADPNLAAKRGHTDAVIDFGDSDADYFAVFHVQCERGAWINITGTNSDDASWIGLNVLPEISDQHMVSNDRSGAPLIILPRKRAGHGMIGFDTLRIVAGNRPGVPRDPAHPELDTSLAAGRPQYGLLVWAPWSPPA